MADTPTDIRTLIRGRGTDPDRTAVAHVVASTGFLALGAVAAALALVSMTFPGFLPLGYGIFRSFTMSALLLGFGALSVVGGAYYVLPRLTGTPLEDEPLARVGLAVIAGSTLAGIVVVGVGLGDGREPFAFPWWIDIPVFGGLLIPPFVALRTLRYRAEHHTFVTVPYVTTALIALPVVYLAGNIPFTSALSTALGDFFSTSAFIVVVAVLGGVGLAYYAVVKHGDRPLAGRQLAQVGYWSLLFGAGWFGVAQLIGGPIPTWLPAVAAVLGLGFPAGMIATSANLLITVEGSWRGEDGADPVVAAAVAGSVFTLVVSVLAAGGSFRSAGTLLGFTTFWEGVTFGLVLGGIPLLLAAWTFQALPRMTGRSLYSDDQARRAVRLTVIGAAGLLATLVVAGVITGYGWAGGGFTGAFAPVGEDWSTAVGVGAVFAGIGSLVGLVAVAGNLMLASLIFRTLTQGKAVAQEMLVAKREDPES